MIDYYYTKTDKEGSDILAVTTSFGPPCLEQVGWQALNAFLM